MIKKIFLTVLVLFPIITMGQSTDNITITKKHLLGKFDPAKEKGYTLIKSEHTNKKGIYARDEMYKAFIAMHDSAAKDGIKLTIVSAFRSFDVQKYVWESKWRGEIAVEGKNLKTSYPNHVERAKKILRYSSMPGTSRHHWGTDIDLNRSNSAYFKTEYGKKVLAWLNKNAAYFGFYRPYTDFGTTRSSGYQPEEWHWSYMATAKKFQKEYLNQIKLIDIEGFEGDETIFELNIIEKYVFGISKECLLFK